MANCKGCRGKGCLSHPKIQQLKELSANSEAKVNLGNELCSTGKIFSQNSLIHRTIKWFGLEGTF